MKQRVAVEQIRPNLYLKITDKEKYMLRMRALAHDSVGQTKTYFLALKQAKIEAKLKKEKLPRENPYAYDFEPHKHRSQTVDRESMSDAVDQYHSSHS